MSDSLLVVPGEAMQTWTLNRPSSRNALDPELVEALTLAVRAANAEPDVRVVVLRGHGPSFCAGADLRHLASYSRPDTTPVPFLRSIIDLTLEMESSETIFLAALHGHAIAGGLEIALACDLVLAANDTLIGDGHVKRNLLPGGGASYRMISKLGSSRAARMALTGAPTPAHELALSGWITRAVPHEELDDVVRDEVALLLAAERAAQVAYKQLLHRRSHAGILEAMRDELDAFATHWLAHDIPAHLHRFLNPYQNGEVAS